MGSEFYKKIREYYDYIFPLNIGQVEFVQHEFVDSVSKILEVGCANGKLTNALSKYNITGIDLEEEFIEMALQRYPDLNFRALNMLDINTLGERYDGIICFGNTLVHIDNKQVAVFCEQAYQSLVAGGKLLIQIVNYDNVLSNNILSLPLLDNEEISFARYYEHGEKFIFSAELTLKRENRIIDSAVELFPIRRDKLYMILDACGFTGIEFYGSFSQTPLKEDSMPLIVKAIK